jgi:RNA polymerase-binding protein DksA
MNPEKAKRELLQLRSRLQTDDRELSESLGISLEEESGDESSDQHMGDVATVTLNREMDLSLQENTEHLLAQVNRALEKIDEGTYGKCDRCGRPIEEGRLEIVPYATLCLQHERELERAP